MVNERVTRLREGPFADAEAAGLEVTADATRFLASGERIRDELLSVAHEPKAEGAEFIDQREMKSWIRHAKFVLNSPSALTLEAQRGRLA